MHELPKTTFLLHCQGGYRSMIAASILTARGVHNFKQIEDVKLQEIFNATGGDVNIIGGEGNNGVDNGYVMSGTNYTPSYGIGGASYWGGGGRGGVMNVGAQTGRAYGSGGGGGSNSNSGGGAAGQIGLVVVEEFA